MMIERLETMKPIITNDMENEKKDFRKLYEDIVQSDWFKRAYRDKSLGECPFDIPELREGYNHEYDGNMDKECIELCDTLNELPGVKTFESCCGHLKDRYSIWFFCEDIDTISRLGRSVDRNYSDGKWEIIVDSTDTNPRGVFWLRSKTIFASYEQMNESTQRLIESILHWFKNDFDSYFHESEGERIRKELIDMVNYNYADEERETLVAWLEKQKPLPGSEDCDGIPGKDYIPVEWVDACERYGIWEIVKKEQKTVEWSKEDEEKIVSVKNLITTGRFTDTSTIRTIWTILDSLRPQQWSEGDKCMLESITNLMIHFDDLAHDATYAGPKWTHPYTKQINWLKSLRPRKEFKPAAGQSMALRMAIQNLLYLKDKDKAYQNLDDQHELANEIVTIQEILSHFEED